MQRLLKDAQGYTPVKISWSVTAYDSIFAPPQLSDDADALNSDHAPKSVKFFLDGAYRTAASMPLAGGLKAALMAAKDSIAHGSLSPFRLLFEQKITLKNGKIYLPYLRFEDLDDLIGRARVFSEKGYRLVLHALGNVAGRQAAEVIKRLKPVGASVEHLLIMDEEDMDIFAGCGAVASLQPGFIPYYAHDIERQGAIGYLKAFPLRSLLVRGVPVCISSDGPCAADDPLHNIRRAVDRKKPDGSVFGPEERLSEFQALSAGTIGGGSSLGTVNNGLNEGAPATFCVVDGDPFSDSSRVVQTWIDGKRAY
jgi:predicted amidohydrolase YtcJ